MTHFIYGVACSMCGTIQFFRDDALAYLVATHHLNDGIGNRVSYAVWYIR